MTKPNGRTPEPQSPSRAEKHRLETAPEAWRRWGPYLSERAWGTVREDYSADGDAWAYFPHDHARSRAYRWNEDGIGGFSDDKGRLCLAMALWNGRDPILKERLFGLSNAEGNHGEDVKECYFYLDGTPTHSFMRMLYKYPQTEFPYEDLIENSRRRSRLDSEYELLETGVFDGDRYFDVFVEWAKAGPDDLLLRVVAWNRGPEAALLHLLPTVWCRNDWDWGGESRRPLIEAAAPAALQVDHPRLGRFRVDVDRVRDDAGAPLAGGEPALLFTENETNRELLFATPNRSPWVKDAFHRFVVAGDPAAVNPDRRGTKACAHASVTIAPGASATLRLRLTRAWHSPDREGASRTDPFAGFDEVFVEREREADEFHASIQPATVTPELALVQRQALAGMLWSKQFYHYVVDRWLSGDPSEPTPPASRLRGRNRDWRHLYNERVMSMPDKWEYPWYAAWDLAFHCVPLTLVDPDFAKSQIDLILREWYLHPNGQVPAYEWAFGDVNPPVLGWAAWRIYRLEQQVHGRSDRAFLERVFHKLVLNFTWWVNRKDSEGNNVFQGGFLGLDNIGVFDRNAPAPSGGQIEQSDATSWMGMFSLDLMRIALELAHANPTYEDIATKFFEHFLLIAAAMNNLGGEGIPLWDGQDEFFYDVLHLPDGRKFPMRLRSFVGLIPLFAVETVEPATLAAHPGFRDRLEWVLENRPDLAQLVSRWFEPGVGERRLLALVRGSRMKRLLRRALDETEFLGEHGLRSLSRAHAASPYTLDLGGETHRVAYEPAESRSGMFGGNSNWRGPIWFPVNFLLIEALRKFHRYYGDDFRIECPTGSGTTMSLAEVSNLLARRLIGLFLPRPDGRRPAMGSDPRWARDAHWRDLVLFHEYFHGDEGTGLGASHQTGWTGLVAELIRRLDEGRTGGPGGKGSGKTVAD